MGQTIIQKNRIPAPVEDARILKVARRGCQLSSIDKPFSAFQIVIVPVVVPNEPRIETLPRAEHTLARFQGIQLFSFHWISYCSPICFQVMKIQAKEQTHSGFFRPEQGGHQWPKRCRDSHPLPRPQDVGQHRGKWTHHKVLEQGHRMSFCLISLPYLSQQQVLHKALLVAYPSMA